MDDSTTLPRVANVAMCGRHEPPDVSKTSHLPSEKVTSASLDQSILSQISRLQLETEDETNSETNAAVSTVMYRSPEPTERGINCLQSRPQIPTRILGICFACQAPVLHSFTNEDRNSINDGHIIETLVFKSSSMTVQMTVLYHKTCVKGFGEGPGFVGGQWQQLIEKPENIG